MQSKNVSYQSGVTIKPFELFQQSKDLLGADFFLFVGICAVGMVIAQSLAIILLGPMMCGMYLCFFAKFRGEPIKFEMLFKGFDHIKHSLIATLIQLALSIVILVFLFILMFVFGIGSSLAATESAILALLMFGISLSSYLLIFVGLMAIHLFTMFAFHLIIETPVDGVQAVKLSYAGVKANLKGMLFYGLISGVAMFLAAALCAVPFFFLLPIVLGANTLLFQQIFVVDQEAIDDELSEVDAPATDPPVELQDLAP